MTRSLLALTLALPLLTTACAEDEPGPGDGDSQDTNDDCWPYCEETSTSIAPDDETALGVAGSAVTDPLPEDAAATLSWASSGDVGLEWGVAFGVETLRFVEAEAVYPTCEGGDVPSIAVECPDYLAVEGSLTLLAEDGSLDAALPLTFSLDEFSVDSGVVSFSAAVEESDLGAAFTLADHVDTSGYDAVSLHLYGEVAADGGLSMTLNAQGTGNDGNVAWADIVEIATVGGGVF